MLMMLAGVPQARRCAHCLVLSPRCLLTSFGQIEMVIRMSYFSGQILTKLSISSPGGPILHLPSSSPDTLVSQSIVPLRS
jgi:hypothetical protein